MSSVVVTGAAGFIGSRICEDLAMAGTEVLALDCMLADSYEVSQKQSNWESLNAWTNIRKMQIDLTDPIPPGLFEGVTAVINEAGMPGLVKSWSEFGLYSKNNIEVVNNLAMACMKANVGHFIQVSTSSVYGFDASGDEQHPTKPISPYGVTKLAAEELLHAYGRSYGLPYSILRYFSVYGPRQRPDMAYHIIIKALLNESPITVYGDGHQSRTNTFVGDISQGTRSCLNTIPSGEIYNLAGQQEYTLLEAIAILEELTGSSAKLKFQPARAGDQRRTKGDSSKARSLLGFNALTALEQGLAEQVQWYLDMQQ